MKLLRAILIALLMMPWFFSWLFSSTKDVSASVSPQNGQLREFFDLGEANRREGNFAQAIDYYKKCLSLAASSGSKKEELEASIQLSISIWNLGVDSSGNSILKYSEESFQKASILAHDIGNRDQESFCLDAVNIHKLYNAAKDLRKNGDYAKSIDNFQKAIDLARKNESPDLELKCLRQMSVCYWEENDFPEFFNLNKKAYELSLILNSLKDQAICLYDIGLYYWKNDNYSSSLKYYDASLTISKKINSIREQTDTLNNMGIIYKEIGNYDKAIEYLTEAYNLDKITYDLDKKTNNTSILSIDLNSLSIDLNNIGTTYRKKGLISNNKLDFNEALNFFNESIKYENLSKNPKTKIKVINNIGTIYNDIENYSEALKYFNIGLSLAETIQDHETRSFILNNIGIVYYDLGNYEESTKYCQQAIDLAQQIKSGYVLWEAYLDMGNSYKKQSKYPEALTSYKESIDVIETTRANIDLEEMKASYFGTDKRIEAYHNLIDLLARLNTAEPEKSYGAEAFSYLERAKARAFLDNLEVAHISVSGGVDAKLANEEKQINADTTALYKKLLMPDLTPEQKAQIEIDLKKNEENYDRLKREIRAANPALATLSPNIITLKEAQSRLLDDKTVFIAYSVGKDSSYGFAISRASVRIFPISSRNNLQKKITDYLKVISDKDSSDFHLGYELFSELVSPALDGHTQRLFIVPDDALYYLPFEALLTATDSTSWLLRKYTIAYAPSLSSLSEIIKRTRTGAQRSKDILALGDPDYGPNEKAAGSADIFQNFYSSSDFKFFRLAYSGIEVQKIAALFPKKREEILQRDEASESGLKKLPLSDFKIIHFAAHALIDDQRPARSAIVLSLDPSSQDDGFLLTRDIYNLRLNADLVSLSACQTGKGQFFRGEGIESLSRAFFYAGASSVLMSLWSVNDQATYQLMERFYAHLCSSKTLMDALKIAKIEMMDSKVFAHPFYWAGFVIIGDAAKVVFPRNRLLWISAILALGLGITLVWGRKSLRKKRSSL